MAAFLLTRWRTGPDWEPTRPMEGQSGWGEHAAAMDALVAEGVILVGGPVGDGLRAVLVCEAPSVDALRAALASDPWTGTHLVDEVEEMTIRLDGRSR